MENVFKKFMVSINVNNDTMDELVRAGFPKQQPTASEMQARREKHLEAAERINRNALRLERTDDLGVIPDSGRLVFGKAGQQKVSFSKVMEDADKLGFVLTAAYVERVPDKSPRLRFWWERGDDAAPVEITSSMRFHMDRMLKRAYGTVYAYDNRATDGGFTFNAVQPMDDTARRDVRDLRVGEGRMACKLRDDARD